MTEVAVDLSRNAPLPPRATSFTARDVFRDRATLGKFTAVLGLGVGSKRIGVRKTWFIPCTVFGAAAYLSLVLFEPEVATLWIIIGILVVKTTFMTTQDIAIDGYMVENLEDSERGVGAAVMGVGRHVAQFSSWAGVAWVYGTHGWPAAVATAAGLLVLFSLPGIIRREPPPPLQAQRRHDRGERPSLIKLLKRPDTRLILPLVVLISFGGGLIASLYVAYLVDVGFTVKQIGPQILAPAALAGTLNGITLPSFINIAGCCFVFYILFDRIEAAVEARDAAELALDPIHSTALTTGAKRHGIG